METYNDLYCIGGLVPTYLTELFTTSNNTTYSLRSNDPKLYVDKLNTNFYNVVFCVKSVEKQCRLIV